MIASNTVTVVLTPELRRLALLHVAEAEQGDDEENLTRWFQEQETKDGYVLDAARSAEEAHMIVVIARAILWQHECCPECQLHRDSRHTARCAYNDA